MEISRRTYLSRILFGAGSVALSGSTERQREILSRELGVPLVDDQGKIIARYRATTRYFVQDLGDGVPLEMAVIPGGSFEMGSDVQADILYPLEQPIHRVSIKPFALGTFPVTQKQWERVMRLPQVDRPMSPLLKFQTGDDLPADILFKTEIQEFLKRVSALAGIKYRLPSEAEWEYSCRAGTTTKYHFGDGISRAVCNYGDGISKNVYLPCGSKNAPNRFGLHDMHGNAMEWCADVINNDYRGAPNDGSAWMSGPRPTSNIVRGGHFAAGAFYVRSALRWGLSNVLTTALGFRVAADLDHGFLDPRIAVPVNAGLLPVEEPGAIAPGTVVRIRVIESGGGVVVERRGSPDPDGLIADQLAGVSVRMDNVSCPVLSVSRDEVTVVAPYEIAGKTEVRVVADLGGQSAAPVMAKVAESAPEFFALESGDGSPLVLAMNEDGSPHSVENPARRGSKLSLYATGEGLTDPVGVNGRIADSSRWPLPAPVLPVRVRIGGVECAVVYAGGESGQVAGVLRVDVRAPEESTGLLEAVLQVGGSVSRARVFVAIG